MTSVMIVGGGHQGLAMAAHMAMLGNKCFLWNRTYEHVREVAETKQIFCSGLINGTAYIENASTVINENLQKLIMVTVPSSAHRDIAKMLAQYVDSSYIIILNPGRTFGILDFRQALLAYGCKSLPLIAETQTIVYTCRRISDNSVTIYAFKKNIPIATTDMEEISTVIEAIPQCIRSNFVPAKSYIETSLGNVGMILHCAPVLMNIGWIENDQYDFKYYMEGISPSIASVLEKMDSERLEMAKKLGYSIESLGDWLDRTYGTKGNTLYEKLQSNIYYTEIAAPKKINHRYIEEDVPNGLVPVESIGRCFGVETPAISLIIDLAQLVMGTNYRESGRRYERLVKVKKE